MKIQIFILVSILMIGCKTNSSNQRVPIGEPIEVDPRLCNIQLNKPIQESDTINMIYSDASDNTKLLSYYPSKQKGLHLIIGTINDTIGLVYAESNLFYYKLFGPSRPLNQNFILANFLKEYSKPKFLDTINEDEHYAAWYLWNRNNNKEYSIKFNSKGVPLTIYGKDNEPEIIKNKPILLLTKDEDYYLQNILLQKIDELGREKSVDLSYNSFKNIRQSLVNYYKNVKLSHADIDPYINEVPDYFNDIHTKADFAIAVLLDYSAQEIYTITNGSNIRKPQGSEKFGMFGYDKEMERYRKLQQKWSKYEFVLNSQNYYEKKFYNALYIEFGDNLLKKDIKQWYEWIDFEFDRLLLDYEFKEAFEKIKREREIN